MQFDASIISCKTPMNGGLDSIASFLPRGNFLNQCRPNLILPDLSGDDDGNAQSA